MDGAGDPRLMEPGEWAARAWAEARRRGRREELRAWLVLVPVAAAGGIAAAQVPWGGHVLYGLSVVALLAAVVMLWLLVFRWSREDDWDWDD